MRMVSSSPPATTACVFGATGGIGSGFVERLAATPDITTLYAGARKAPPAAGKITPFAFDLGDEASIAAAAQTINRPDLTIIARARDPDHAAELYLAGATDAVPETLESSLQLSEAVLVDLGVAMGPVIASIHEKRDEYRAQIQEEGKLGYKPKLRTSVSEV